MGPQKITSVMHLHTTKQVHGDTHYVSLVHVGVLTSSKSLAASTLKITAIGAVVYIGSII